MRRANEQTMQKAELLQSSSNIAEGLLAAELRILTLEAMILERNSEGCGQDLGVSDIGNVWCGITLLCDGCVGASQCHYHSESPS